MRAVTRWTAVVLNVPVVLGSAFITFLAIQVLANGAFPPWHDVAGLLLCVSTPFLNVAALWSREPGQVIICFVLATVGSILQFGAAFVLLSVATFGEGPSFNGDPGDAFVTFVCAIYGCFLIANLIAMGIKLFHMRALPQ